MINKRKNIILFFSQKFIVQGLNPEPEGAGYPVTNQPPEGTTNFILVF